MANYYLNTDGTVTSKKKKKEYVLNDDGSITEKSTNTTSNSTTTQRLNTSNTDSSLSNKFKLSTSNILNDNSTIATSMKNKIQQNSTTKTNLPTSSSKEESSLSKYVFNSDGSITDKNSSNASNAITNMMKNSGQTIGVRKVNNTISNSILLPNGNMVDTTKIQTTPVNHGLAIGENLTKDLVKSSEIIEEEGVNPSSVAKTVGSTAGTIATQILEGVSNVGKGVETGIIELYKDTVANQQTNVPTEVTEAREKLDTGLFGKATESLENLQEEYLEGNSVLGETSKQILQGIGYSAALGGTELLGGAVLMNVLTFASATGSSLEELQGKTGLSIGEKYAKAIGSGTIETLTENLFGLFGKTGLDDALANTLAQNVSSSMGKALTRLGVTMGSEASEEFISYGLNYVYDRLLDSANSGTDKFSEDWDWDEVFNSMFTAGISAGITGAGITLTNVNQIANENNVSTKEALNAYENSLDETGGSSNKLMEEIPTVQNNKETVGDTLNLEQNAPNNQILNETEQTIQPINNNTQNQSSSEINKAGTEGYNQSENLQSYIESASRYNIDTNNEVTKAIFNVADNRGIKVTYNNDVFTNDAQNAIWTENSDGSREVIINSNSEKALQNIIIHELTHDLEGTKEYAELSIKVLEKLTTQENFQEAVQDIANTYAKIYGEDSSNFFELSKQEIVADFLGENLGNQEFVNELVQAQNRSTISRIYNWLSNKLKSFKNKITGNTEAEYWRTVKENFERAIEAEYGNKSKQDTKYSISENSEKGSFLITQDNQGRKLNKEQQEYFKNSKVVDENGNLLTVYHGTAYDFNVFNYDKLGENTNSLGAGFYFSDNENTSNEYAKGTGTIKEVYIDIEKPMSYGKTTMTAQEYQKFIEAVNEKTNGRYLEDYGGLDEALMEYEYGGDDIDLVNAVHNASGLTWEKTYEILRNATGYDGIISEKGFINDGETIYVAFNSNQIKNVDNTKPTTNDDIRYSQTISSKWQEFLTKNSVNEGTRTKISDISLPIAETRFQDVVNNAEYIPNDIKSELLSNIDGMTKTSDLLNNFEEFVNSMNQEYESQYNEILDSNTYETGRKEIYQKYLKSNSDYDKTSLEKAKELVQANSQGRRTKTQWLEIARQIGIDIANKSNTEIEEITYKSWLDERPNNKNNLNRQGEKFVSFISDEWIDTIYNTVKEVRENVNSKQENTSANIENQIKIDSENFAKQIEEVKNGTFPKNKTMLTLLSKTPQPLIDIGLNDYPITMTQKHLDTIMNESGKYKNANYHNLGEDIVKQLPEAINNPLDIVQSNTKSDSVVLTTYLADKNDNTVIASIKIDGTGLVNDVIIDTNVMTSAYGRNNYEKFMKDNLENDRVLYDIDRGVIKKIANPRLQLPSFSDSSVDTVNNVSTTNNIIPQNSNNMQDNILPVAENKEINLPIAERYKDENTNGNITDEVYREEINDGKTRKHYQSVFESESVGKTGKQVAKELFKNDTYTPIANASTLADTNDLIEKQGIEKSYDYIETKLKNKNEKITLNDIAMGERLIQIYSQTDDYAKVQSLIQDVAILGTELGQQVQALSLIKKMSPEGQLQLLQKMVDRTNTKENTNIKITEDMTEKILKSKTQEELQNNVTEVAEEVAEQIPLTTKDKLRSWRYLSMLGNPRTHIRNVVGNVAMNITQNIKNAVAGGIEDVANIFYEDMERTKTLKRSNQDQKSFAKQDAEVMQDQIDGGGKYDIKNIIQNSKRNFDNNVLNAISEFNSNMLDVEDKIFLKTAYKQALQNYMTANNLSSNDMVGETLEKARQYASIEAQEATFHQFSALANALNETENKGGVAGGFTSAILPFKKTPINIAKTGIEYSPIGLVKTLTYNTSKVIKESSNIQEKYDAGKITQKELNSEKSKLVTGQIDSMTKGLTGTSIVIIGFMLAQAGILKAGNNGDEDEFEEDLGVQNYSIQIGDNTYSLDWLAPAAIPLFIGASAYSYMTDDDSKSTTFALIDSVANAMEPMTEMSMLSSLTSVLTSYQQGSSSVFFDWISNATSSYLGQYVPTALGQITKTIDPYVRDTSSTATGLQKKLEQFRNQQMAKIPGLSTLLPVKTDVWGEEEKRSDNVVQRFLENAVLPYTREKVEVDSTDQELLDVYTSTGDSGVLPSTANKYFTINGEKYSLSSEEYNEVKKEIGSTSKELLDDLTSSSSYQSMTDDEKATAISNVYSYAKELAKVNYAKDNEIEYETSKLYDTVQELGSNAYSYFEYKAQTSDMSSSTDKTDYLLNMDVSNNTKLTIYENAIASDSDKIYDLGISTSEKISYLKYKVASDGMETTSEKIEYLKNMNVSSNAKSEIYSKVIATSDTTFSNLQLITNDSININEYLEYKTTEFTADEDTSSNIVGKTVSGSKKEKVVDYLNNSSFSTIEKLYLYAQSYSLSSTEKQYVENYLLNSLTGVSYSDLKELFIKFGATEYKDGTIGW